MSRRNGETGNFWRQLSGAQLSAFPFLAGLSSAHLLSLLAAQVENMRWLLLYQARPSKMMGGGGGRGKRAWCMGHGAWGMADKGYVLGPGFLPTICHMPYAICHSRMHMHINFVAFQVLHTSAELGD